MVMPVHRNELLDIPRDQSLDRIAATIVTYVTAVFLFFAATLESSHATEWLSGNNLYEHCNITTGGQTQILKETLCMGYVIGVIESGAYDACPPDNLGFRQATDIVTMWLRNNPAKRHLNAALLIRNILESEYPCS